MIEEIQKTEQPMITPEEGFWLNMLRLNKATPRLEIRKSWELWRFRVTFSWRSKKNLWGRFGGGWNWKLGVMVGGSDIILDILVFSLRISKR